MHDNESIKCGVVLLIDTRERVAMETTNKSNPDQKSTEAEAHIKSAHQILKALQKKIGEHPEIGVAITKLEMALNVLAVETGGML
jgi:hypothetical protein